MGSTSARKIYESNSEELVTVKDLLNVKCGKRDFPKIFVFGVCQKKILLEISTRFLRKFGKFRIAMMELL